MNNITVSNINNELKDNYLRYAQSVILERAVPTLNDGLKPVQRRILWAMWKMSCFSKSKHTKSAKITGFVLGNFHPHGDISVYESLIKISQNHKINHKFIDGRGNFGSFNCEEAAAYRYTECRLDRFAEQVYFQDIDEEIVDMIPNFDNTTVEPVILPSRIPLILLNNISGIAVGISTDIPSHNLNEVCDLTIKFIQDEKISDKQLMKSLAPDFPLGGLLCSENLSDAYLTGKSNLKYRSVINLENDGKNKSLIICTIPPNTEKDSLISEIIKAVKEEKIIGVKELTDESDRTGIRINVELDKEADPNEVMEAIYKNTRFETTIKYNAVVLDNGKPKLVTLRNILEAFVKFRRECILRRTEFRKKNALDRKEILDGLLIIIPNAIKVVEYIRKIKDGESAIKGLQKEFKLTERQAEFIYNLPLRRISKLDECKYKEENDELKKYIKEQESIIKNKKILDEIMIREIKEIQAEFGKPRKTQIVSSFSKVDMTSKKREEKIVVFINSNETIKATSEEEYNTRKSRNTGISGTKNVEGNYPKFIIKTNSNEVINLFTEKGNRYELDMGKLVINDKKRPQPISNYIEGFKKEVIIGYAKKELEKDEFIITLSENGKIRKLNSDSYNKKGIEFYPEKVIDNLIVKKDDEVVISTKDGQVLRLEVNDINDVTSKQSSGIAGIKSDNVLGISVIKPDDFLIVVSEDGYCKRIKSEEIKVTGRNGSGISVSKEKLVYCKAEQFGSDNNLVLYGEKNTIIRENFILEVSRTSKGSCLLKNEKILGIIIE